MDGERIEETTNEKLLGVVINNTLSWKEHFYGDKENPGLLSEQPTQAESRDFEKTLKVHEQREVENDGEWDILLKTNILFVRFWECEGPSLDLDCCKMLTPLT